MHRITLLAVICVMLFQLVILMHQQNVLNHLLVVQATSLAAASYSRKNNDLLTGPRQVSWRIQ